MSKTRRTKGWKIALVAVSLAAVIGWHVYDRAPRFRKVKDGDKSVPAEMVLTELLPANENELRLKLYASERDGRPLRICWIDDNDEGGIIDLRRARTGVLCADGDLAGGVEFTLPPGRYRLCFELSQRGLKNEVRPFNLRYSLYEFR